ncbi:helix-turn-helix domain-containing protein [Ralstonia pseudosolanacearum]|uniref:helix-turn-helix domain-containing protein n=1 Tax=Ralstonia pseudosolanacearum TaxID=1310165 RepID=UPI003EDF3965
METWNNRLAKALQESAFNKNSLAEQVGVSAPTVSAWVGAAGINPAKSIAADNLLRACRTLNVRPEWVLFREGAMRPLGAAVETSKEDVSQPSVDVGGQYDRAGQEGRLENQGSVAPVDAAILSDAIVLVKFVIAKYEISPLPTREARMIVFIYRKMAEEKIFDENKLVEQVLKVA